MTSKIEWDNSALNGKTIKTVWILMLLWHMIHVQSLKDMMSQNFNQNSNLKRGQNSAKMQVKVIVLHTTAKFQSNYIASVVSEIWMLQLKTLTKILKSKKAKNLLKYMSEYERFAHE